MNRLQKPVSPPVGIPKDAWLKLTPFTQRVYRATFRILQGQTRSYQWVARQIGVLRAVRAVGNALNRNPFAPLVPCHRVVRSDGTLGGFARGAAHKRTLLRREGARARI